MSNNVSPKISIIIPSFNEENYIGRCLDSILNQTFSDFEIICVDDKSTDETPSIIKTYVKNDSRIKFLVNPEKGVSSARNFGIINSSGDYFLFVDADDFIQPQLCEFLLKAINENNCEMSVCRYERTSFPQTKFFDYSCKKCICDEFISFFDFDFNFNNEMIIASSCFKLIKRELIEKNENFRNYRIGEDTIFCANLWVSTKDVYLVDLPLYCYFENPKSVTHSKYYDDKVFDYILTRFICFDIFKTYQTKKLSSFYLDRGMKYLLSYNFNLKYASKKNKFKSKMNSLFLKYFIDFLKCKDISIKHRLSVIFFYIFPFFYEKYRKHIDRTL